MPDRLPARKRLRTLVITAAYAGNATLSYQHGWPRALFEHPALDVDIFDLGRRGRSLGDRLGRQFRSYDAIVLLHSAFSNERLVPPALADRIRRSRAVRVFFIGNEYKLMPEKMAFAEEIGTDLLVSQLEGEDALNLYRERLGCPVVGIPNTGLDHEVFRSVTPTVDRRVDLGYRAFESPWYLGHRERPLLAGAFSAAAAQLGLDVDISLDPARRMDERGWAAFLDSCVGQLGSEAGGDYFELDDRTRHAVNVYLGEQPEAPFESVFEQFFRDYPDPVSGRCISSRIIEAAGTRTAQLLIEGEYSGYLQPDIHYIPLRRDLSNVDEAVAKLRDDAFRREIVDNAYLLVHEQLTFPRLLDRFHAALEPLLR